MLCSFRREFGIAKSLFATVLLLCSCSSNGGKYTGYTAEQTSTTAYTYSGQGAAGAASTWNKAAAVSYLDQRERWWMQWKDAKRDNDTFCISCHTNLPFVFAHSALRAPPTETKAFDCEDKIVEDVKRRVQRWDSVESYYGDKEDADGNGPGSRATEAVLNVVILVFHDSLTGELSEDTRLAFKNMWALQQVSGSEQGAWLWQKFRLSPWEASESPYFGASLAALAVGIAPRNYRARPEIQSNLASLRQYLDRGSPRQPLLNRIDLLWASTKWPGLLTPEQQKSIIGEIYEKQKKDGGWSLSSLMWSSRYLGIPSLLTTRRRNDWTPQETKSDGFATAYLAFVLEQAGVPRGDDRLATALTWLVRNQDARGFWTAYSLNRRRDLDSDVGRFMTDAATAFAVLALNENGSQLTQSSGP